MGGCVIILYKSVCHVIVMYGKMYVCRYVPKLCGIVSGTGETDNIVLLSAGAMSPFTKVIDRASFVGGDIITISDPFRVIINVETLPSDTFRGSN